MESVKIDTKGQDCPLPLIALKNALAEAEEGQEIELEFTCPEATVNLPNHCQEAGVEILSFDKNESKSWTIKVRK
ncbi:MAG: sulfurtransferase TusA family protein [Eggerthellaceae bacterium]|nr:sulfurtransferase TusA family protein [Eggerthellaceae bacterium]